MIFKIRSDGSEDVVEIKDLRKGDLFYAVDGKLKGPVMLAEGDASQSDHPKRPGRLVWACKARLVGSFAN